MSKKTFAHLYGGAKMPCQDFVDLLVELGFTAKYVTAEQLPTAFLNQDLHTIVVFLHDNGQDVIILSDDRGGFVTIKFGQDDIRQEIVGIHPAKDQHETVPTSYPRLFPMPEL